MDIQNVVAELTKERQRIDQAIVALQGLGADLAPRRGRPPKFLQSGNVAFMPKRRTMSAAARRRISDAMKKRWAQWRKTKAA